MWATGLSVCNAAVNRRKETGSAEADVAQSEMLAGLAAITNAMSETGPFFFGSELGIVDIALVPFAFRIEFLLSHYKGFHLPGSGAGWPRFQLWSGCCSGGFVFD